MARGCRGGHRAGCGHVYTGKRTGGGRYYANYGQPVPEKTEEEIQRDIQRAEQYNEAEKMMQANIAKRQAEDAARLGHVSGTPYPAASAGFHGKRKNSAARQQRRGVLFLEKVSACDEE